MKKIAVQLTNITKEYSIHHEKPTLVEKFIHGRDERFKALENISLTIYQGEKIGIYGPNGCGKTTLLKIISGITTASSGKIDIRGKVISLIDLEAGFQMDLTGYENIYLNSSLLGISKQKTTELLQPIIDFAGIHKFIDAPMFTYSQGMKLRLGMSIALLSQPDIFVIDESIGMGDAEFRSRSLQALRKLASDKKVTVILVIQFMDFLIKYSSRIITMNSGKVVSDKFTSSIKTSLKP